jgi:sulfite reductase (ferredoxin)
MTNPAKESKAQRVERLKREKNPWEGLDEIRRFGREGFASIPPEWVGTYFRWWGVYTQGDGAGVIGGKNGEGKALPYFMVRIRIPNGLLHAHQLRTIAEVTERYARGNADLTVRQNIQLHWVTIEALPEVLDALWSAGLTTKGSCGDDTRNITGCPLAGVDADEIFDASPIALEANRFFVGNADFYNLPRKFKICITGCRSWCAYPEINDVGLTAVTRRLRGQEEIGFSLRVAGGLSTDPHLATRINAFVRQGEVVPVLRGIAEIFRDSDVLRENRERARLKFLFLRHGWTPEIFQQELEKRIGFKLEPAADEQAPNDVYRDHVGIHAQKQTDRYYVGAAVLRGRISATQMRAAADLSDRFAGGEVRITNMQNLIVVNTSTRWPGN